MVSTVFLFGTQHERDSAEKNRVRPLIKSVVKAPNGILLFGMPDRWWDRAGCLSRRLSLAKNLQLKHKLMHISLDSMLTCLGSVGTARKNC